MLNAQQTSWFTTLTSKRENAVKVLEDEGLLNVFVSHIVDTYRESAHFIFELLQNADDVLATKVRFELKKDGILFAHNGKINFSISDPKIERKVGVVPGHLNAITTFSLSTKKEEIENKIGKFGIGFKSVFQYTNKPEVINPPFNFAIENYMIPRRIINSNRKLNIGETTLFWLPFDKSDKPAVEAYEEISEKLQSLKNPLLFLHSLKTIDIKTNEMSKSFSKAATTIKVQVPNATIVEKIKLNDDTILCFNQTVQVQDKDKHYHNLPINIGFAIDKDGKISSEDKYRHYFKNAWCFFPTQQETKLNYIVNAPFILTPNREALKEDRIENKQLVVHLANLFELSLQVLKSLGYINEEFFTTIPNPLNLPSNFKLIGEKIINKLRSGEFVPTKEKDHVAVSNSYVCTENLLAELLSYNNYQPLRVLTSKPGARIVFTERKVFSDQNLFVYFYKTFSADQLDLQATWLGAKFTKELLEKLPKEFCLKFFLYLIERSNQILAKGQPLWTKPFIPVTHFDTDLIVTPNNKAGEPQVFIGGEKVKGRFVLKDFLIKNAELKTFFTSTLHFTVPDKFDDFLLSLKKYEPEDSAISIEEATSDFNVIKELLDEVSPNKRQQLILQLKEIKYLPCRSDDGATSLICPSKNVVYYPTKELTDYFSKSTNNKSWVDLEMLGLEDCEDTKVLFKELEIEFSPYYFATADQGIDELDSFLSEISLTESIYLADLLFKLQTRIDFKKDLPSLRNSEWLFDSESGKKPPNAIKVGKLHAKYPAYFDSIHIALGAIIDTSQQRYAGLNEKEKALLEAIAPSLNELSPEEIKAALASLIREKKAKKVNHVPQNTDEFDDNDDVTTPEGLLNSWTKDPIANANRIFAQDTLARRSIPSLPNGASIWQNEEEDQVEENPGDLVSTPIVGNQYRSDRQESKKQQFEKEIELEAKRNQLIELANQYEPYSFAWFKILLELEDNFTAEDRLKKNPINVVFSKASIDQDGLLVLSETPFIPPTIEDLGEISIQIYFDDNKKTIKGEIVSPQKLKLKIKLSNPDQVANIDLTQVSRVVVQSSSPDFILERLKTAFAKLDMLDTDKLNSADQLPNNLKFIFGPPGTGKTTFLSWMIGGKCPIELTFCNEKINPFMEQKGKRVLVLTPTNKAADVLVEKVLKNYRDDNDHPSWLFRFGQTISLENETIFIGDRKLPATAKTQCTLVTTIARFPYDYFKVGDDEEDWDLRDFNWDVIVFDEASMIQQAALLYVIYYSKQINPNVEIWIGGDPFQIPPIFQFEFPYWSYIPEPAVDYAGNPLLDEKGIQFVWKQDGGNIYSFVGLSKDDSFTNPKTEPHRFAVHPLMVQYRSLEPIGTLFSHYRYGGVLETKRTDEAIQKNSKLAPKEMQISKLSLAPLNIINFPIKKYGSIFKQQAIKGSPFQVYSAIFTVELIRYIQENITVHSKERYKIGIISPYAKQNLIVSKLIDKIGRGKVEVVNGTVHGFQGDECDLIIVILNPPKKITRSPRSFLNKKNILNVAISRARDKMIVLTPFDPDKEINVDDLHQIARIKYLIKKLPECKNYLEEYTSTDIETLLWENENYIEDNCFTTSHQEVNIYTEAAKRYEIRLDENAMDVQVKPELFAKNR